MFRFCLALMLTAGAAGAQEWPRNLWDPGEVAEGQIDLPLPCGGAMAFIRVATPTEPDNPLADRRITLGGADQQTGYLDYFHNRYLRGGFTSDGQPFYYIGKYEVTRDQYAAVQSLKSGECPKAARGGARPQGSVSWFDAIAFTRELTEWIRQEKPEQMPRADGAFGYLRLPTETEWEYAARGGGKLDDLAFRAALPPMETGIEDYAWYSGRRSANGSIRPVGMKLPNPLGIYGMFGGVEELMLEPFRLNRTGREHGQTGGVVTRGGSIETPGEELRSSLRAEWPYFRETDGAATAFESFGLRLVISTPVNSSLARTNAVRERWLEEFSATANDDQDPLAVLDRLQDNVTDLAISNELAYVRGQVVADRKSREEAAAEATRLMLLNGAVLHNWIIQEQQNIARREEVIRQFAALAADKDQDEALRERNLMLAEAQKTKLTEAEAAYELATSAYLSALVSLQSRHPPEELEAAAALLILELKERGQERLAPSVDKFLRSIAARRETPSLSREQLLELE